MKDFILDGILRDEKGQNMNLSQKAITQVKNSKKVGHKILIQFLGKSWAHRIETALELRKLDEGVVEENTEILKATEELFKMGEV